MLTDIVKILSKQVAELQKTNKKILKAQEPKENQVSSSAISKNDNHHLKKRYNPKECMQAQLGRGDPYNKCIQESWDKHRFVYPDKELETLEDIIMSQEDRHDILVS